MNRLPHSREISLPRRIRHNIRHAIRMECRNIGRAVRMECRNIRRTLCSRGGVTMAFAMVVFTVITFLCVSLLQWSESTARSAAAFTPFDEQEYLTVYSAAKLFQDAVGDNSLRISFIDSGDNKSLLDVEPLDADGETINLDDNAFMKILADMITDIQTNPSDDPDDITRRLTISVPSFVSVTADVRMKSPSDADYTDEKDYQITATFSIAETADTPSQSETADTPSQSITLQMNADREILGDEEIYIPGDDDDEEPLTVTIETVTWPTDNRLAWKDK